MRHAVEASGAFLGLNRTLTTQRGLFWLLCLAALILLPAFAASAIEIRVADLGRLYDGLLIASLAAHGGLILWMFLGTVFDKSLSAEDKRNWQLLLLVGASITAAVYLWRRLYRTDAAHDAD